ncbi:STAS domain-containing protein [Streptomyces sp. V4-01]|uniref:Anti-sigma factor antagonist n=1 Tax=Actinacidiphila polyblastidii TaxID=3110430 RepID=A0ABU7P3R3_9ACTN|nr:STAS domain-containing protein [Streptomyces sp. V4-01]
MHDPVLTVTAGAHPAGPTLITAAGELDYSTAADLRELIGDTPFTPAGVVIDLTGLLYCDSTGITVLVTAYQLARSAGAPLALAGVSGSLERVFGIAGLYEIFASYPTVEQAVGAM